MKKALSLILALALCVSLALPALAAEEVKYLLVEETIDRLSNSGNEYHAYAYDAEGKLTQETHGSATTTYEYDAEGNLTKETYYGNTITYEYDAAGNLAKKKHSLRMGGSSTYVYEYDLAGNCTKETCIYSGGNVSTTVYTYDGAGRLTKVTFSNSSGTSETTVYVYDAAGRLTKETRGGVTNTYAYDGAGRLTRKEYISPDRSEIYTYAYDGAGRPTQETEQLSYDGYSYTKTTVYAYDGAGNRTKEAWSDSAGDSETYLYEYDGAGNCTKETCIYSDGDYNTTVYEYDAAGHITKKAWSNYYFGSYRSYTGLYEYDAAGNCTKWVYSDSDGYASTTVYVNEYDSWGHLSRVEESLDNVLQNIHTYKYIRLARELVSGFTDVFATAYYADAVTWAVNHEPQITNGVSATEFGPADTVTRAQAVTFLWRAANCPEPKDMTSPFSDVADTNAWYYKAVLWAAEQGITNGVNAMEFGLGNTLAYDQMLTFMARAGGAEAGGADWSEKAVAWAAENGLTDGLRFNVKGSCPRADVVYCLWKQLA